MNDRVIKDIVSKIGNNVSFPSFITSKAVDDSDLLSLIVKLCYSGNPVDYAPYVVDEISELISRHLTVICINGCTDGNLDTDTGSYALLQDGIRRLVPISSHYDTIGNIDSKTLVGFTNFTSNCVVVSSELLVTLNDDLTKLYINSRKDIGWVVSSAIRDDLNSSGIYDGITIDKTIALVFDCEDVVLHYSPVIDIVEWQTDSVLLDFKFRFSFSNLDKFHILYNIDTNQSL